MTPATTERLAGLIVSASWPDGGHDGFPTRRVAEMIATVLADAGVGFVAEAQAEALRGAADEVGDWEFPLDADASKDAIAARVVLLERLSRLVYRLRERADRIGGAS